MSVIRKVLALLYEREGAGLTALEASEQLEAKYNSVAIALARLHREECWGIEVEEDRNRSTPGRPRKRYTIKEK